MGFAQKVCKSILNNVGAYNSFCSKIRKHPQGSELQNNFYNERTVAHHFDVSLQNDLAPCYIVSECAIPGDLVPSALKHQLATDISCNNSAFIEMVNKSSKYYIPDTVVINLEVESPVVFIEYKVDTKFTYYKLAIDYLKYKCYSSAMRGDSVFIYVLFYKDLKHGGVIAIRNPKQVELDLKLSKDNIFNGKSLFVFDRKNDEVQCGDNFRIGDELAKLIEEADETVERIQMIPPGHEGDDKIKASFYYRLRNSFGPRVITARRIMENFRPLLEMDRRIRSRDIGDVEYDIRDDSYSFGFNSYRSNDFNETICKELANHFHRQIRLILGEDKRNISEMYTLYNKRSLWILLMLRKFAIDMEWSDIVEMFSFDVSTETIDKYTELLNFAYANNLNSFRKLCLGLLYYINKLYPLIFEIDGGVIESEKDFYLYDRYEQLLNRIAKNIMKFIGVDRIRGFSVGKDGDQARFAKVILDL